MIENPVHDHFSRVLLVFGLDSNHGSYLSVSLFLGTNDRVAVLGFHYPIQFRVDALKFSITFLYYNPM